MNLTGIIISEPKENQYNYSYIIKSNNKKFIIYIKKGDEPLLEYGDLVKINGEFSIPPTQRNYKGFDYREYLKTKKIYGSIFVQNNGLSIIKKNEYNIFLTISNNMRNYMTKTAQKILPQKTSGLLIGILIGDTSYITEEDQENFRESSLYHVLAVSRLPYNIHNITVAVTY